MARPGVRILRSGNQHDGEDGVSGRSGSIRPVRARALAHDQSRECRCGLGLIRTAHIAVPVLFPIPIVTLHASWISMPRQYCRLSWSGRRAPGGKDAKRRDMARKAMVQHGMPPRSPTLSVRAGGYSSAIGKIRKTVPNVICASSSIMPTTWSVCQESQVGQSGPTGRDASQPWR